jgi:hypothetical protein
MKKYVYFMTSNQHWFDIAVKLYNDKIAEPILWMGDHNHYKLAKDKFGGDVVKDFDFFKFKSHLINKEVYNGKYNDFFISQHYFITKDRSLKMMDRIDDLSVMSRLDREVIFNNTVLWTLGQFEKNMPDALISVENPHSHIHYTILQICNYLNIECIKFISWTPLPILNINNAHTGELIKPYKKINNDQLKKLYDQIDFYVDNISNLHKDYKTSHTELERLESKKISWKLLQIIKLLKEIFRKYKSKKLFLEMRSYNPLNPFNYGPFKKLSIIKKRKKSLKKHCYFHLLNP